MFSRRGGPPCPPVVGIRPGDAGQARRPVPTVNNLEGRIGLFQQPLKGVLKKPRFRDSAYGADQGRDCRGQVATCPCETVRFCSSFRRKPESIFAFVFSPPRSDVFTPGRGGSESNTKTKGVSSAFRSRTPRDNKVVAAPPGEKSKWIPAFAGMTAVVNSDQG